VIPNYVYVLAVGAAVVFMVYRQFASRRVEESRRALLIALALVAWGVVSLSRMPFGGATGLTMLAVGAVAGVAMGVVRGTAVRIWVREDGVAWQRGGGLLAMLWVASIGVRMGLAYAVAHAGVSQAASFAEIPVFFGATLAAQNAYVLVKMHAIDLSGKASGGARRGPATT
jgi:hypothetical protein